MRGDLKRTLRALAFLAAVRVTYGDSPLHVPQVRLPLMAKAPVVDGMVNESEWSDAARMERFAGADGRLSPQEASFWIGCDAKEIFVAVVSETPPGGRMLSQVTPLPEAGDARTWSDDSVEMVLDPLRADTRGRRRLYHANLNARGAINDTAYSPGGGGEAWRGRWRTASAVAGDRWHFEAALPLADMGVEEADLAKPFGVRIVRNWQQRAVGPEQTEWSPLGGAYLSPDTLPVVTWDPAAPIVQVLQLHDPGKSSFHARLAIRSPRAEPATVQATIRCVPANSAPTTWDRALTVPAGETVVVEFPAASVPGEEVYVWMQVASPDGAAVYYARDFFWKLERPEPLWAIDPDADQQVDVRFAYFPYQDTLKVRVDVGRLGEREKVTGAVLSIRRRGAAEPLASASLPALEQFVGRIDWKIPPLSEGRYELNIDLKGIQTGSAAAEFDRHVLPWEHNTLGRSDVVIEPFGPVEVRGRKVRTVLRTHMLNGLGLWDQVESVGEPLLASPMRLEVQARGKRSAVTGKRLRFIEKGGSRVVAESHWATGHLKGITRSEWDIDGMMRWTLEIEPSKEAVDALTLVIPLEDRRMPLFHACTDGLRFNAAGATPAGQGRVWDGSRAARNSIIGSYVPYVWLGAEERGLAVFGDNDRGWARDPGMPCQELVRNGEVLELRLNLMAVPGVIGASRRIGLAFQATPTKPMPEGWRTWTVNLSPHPASRRSAQFLGCCYQWGALTPYDDIYPRDEDFRVYEKLAEARRTGSADWAFVERWIRDARLPSEAERPSLRSNLEYGFRICSTKPNNVIPYTNPRGFRHDTREGQTFLDEWHVDAYLSRKAGYGGGSTYGCNPVESFRDYAMWHYRKMLETFADGIYWDNVYLKACFDTVGTDAYELLPDTVQPSCGLFAMRELIRRTAVLAHEMGKRPFNMVHMTNTAIAPILSFCQSHLTWEDRTGDSDFQDRFSRDYLRAESIGRQHGSVPFALVLVHGPDEKKNEWARRTAAGVLLTHEMRSIMNDDPYRGCLLRLLDFGYGQPGTRVFNYWERDVPVRIEGSETTALVLSKPGNAMVIVCDYGGGGHLTLEVDRRALNLGPEFTARDVETGEALTAGGSRVAFSLKRHDFRMIHLRE